MTSIVITYINEEDFLTEALQSAFGQDLDSAEIIVVCNAPVLSNKNHPLSDKFNFEFIHEPNAGSANARNTGLKHANGEWVQFLDVDDLLLPGKISHQLVRGVGTVIVSPHQFRFLNGKTKPSKWLADDIWCGILDSGLGSTSSMLWHRQTLLDIGGWATDYQSHQEYELLFRFAAAGHQISLDENSATIVRERSSGSITLNTKSVRAREGIRLRENIWQYLFREKMTNQTRENAFLQYIFRQLRGLYRVDRKETMTIYSAYFKNAKFKPGSNGIPLYSFFYKSLGFNYTERLLSAYSSMRNSFLPFLPRNK
ncbi:MAG: glycosyltransferase family A protein [Saprospiraceae bacterium]